MAEAAGFVVGEHDFTSFAAVDPERGCEELPVSNVRQISASSWTREGDEFIYTVRGSGFLHHMVRNLVGTMLDAGRGYRKASEIPAMIAARARSAAGPTAPARALFLHSIEYGGSENRP